MGYYDKGISAFENKDYIVELAERRQWVSADGRTQAISSMDSNHIRNCIMFLERKRVAGRDVLISAFQSELDARGCDLPPDAELEDRWRKLCFITRDLFAHYKKCKGPALAQRYKEMLDDLGVDVR